jgi:hypothetical protein
MGCLLNPFGEQTDKELSQWDKGNQKEGVRPNKILGLISSNRNPSGNQGPL